MKTDICSPNPARSAQEAADSSSSSIDSHTSPSQSYRINRSVFVRFDPYDHVFHAATPEEAEERAVEDIYRNWHWLDLGKHQRDHEVDEVICTVTPVCNTATDEVAP